MPFRHLGHEGFSSSCCSRHAHLRDLLSERSSYPSQDVGRDLYCLVEQGLCAVPVGLICHAVPVPVPMISEPAGNTRGFYIKITSKGGALLAYATHYVL